MKWNKIAKRLIPSFWKKNQEEVHMEKELDHLLYEFSIDVQGQSIDTEKIKKDILLNPYCLLSMPSIKLDENPNNKSVKISFHVLKEEIGKTIEDLIVRR